MIKKLVLPACGQNFLYVFGVLKYLQQQGYWDRSNISHIYATSAGSFISVLIALDIDMDTLKNYLIERPWNKIIPKPKQLLSNITDTGILDKEILSKVFDPLFKMKGIDLNISMYDFFCYSNIFINIFVTNLSTFSNEIFSHINTPSISVLDAVYMSCTIPVLFKPTQYKDSFYIDGGIFNRYPVHNLPPNSKSDTLSISITKNNENYSNIYSINTIVFLKKIIASLLNIIETQNCPHVAIENEVTINFVNGDNMFSFTSWKNLFFDSEHRKEKINIGEQYGNIFVSRKLLNQQILDKLNSHHQNVSMHNSY